MAEILFSLELLSEQFAISLSVQGETRSRFLYRSTLQEYRAQKEVLSFLMQQELTARALSPLSSAAETTPFNRIRIAPAKIREALALISKSGGLYWKGKKLLLDPFTAHEWHLEAEEKEEGALSVSGVISGWDMALCEALYAGESLWFVKEGVLAAVKGNYDKKWIDLVYPAAAILKEKRREQFIDQFTDGEPPRAPKVHWKREPLAHASQEKLSSPLPFLQLKDRFGAAAELWMEYPVQGAILATDLAPFPGRNQAEERLWERDLLETGFSKKQVGSAPYFCPMDQVAKSIGFLLELGWKVFDYQKRKVVCQSSERFEIEEKQEKIAIKAEIDFEGYKSSLANLLGSFNRKEHFVQLSPGVVGLIDREKIEAHWGDLAEEELGKEELLVRRSRFYLLSSVPELRKELSLFDAQMESCDPGKGFCGTLYSYQKEGLSWLKFLSDSGFHGLLADEMGLGKTVQVLALFSLLEAKQPHLIVMPTTLLFNWRKELERFLPTASFCVHQGPRRACKQEEFEGKQLILTTYALLRQDLALFQQMQFDLLVLDEAQQIKNSDSQAARAACSLQARMRLAITGTPVENSYDDLWSLFHFLIPDLLGEASDFRAQLTAAASDPRYRSRLQKKIRPFLLRRSKELVAEQLPEKIEQVVWVEMEGEQREFYDRFLAQGRKALMQKVEAEGVAKQRLQILEMILRLRQICCHPQLIEHSSSLPSAKLERVLADLEELVAEKRKVLVYSQFTQMLRRMGEELNARGMRYLYLDGETADREEAVRRFQEEDQEMIFLVSLKAGGVGLNLTRADYVFLFDPWWNEAVEQQAIDRAHRVGRESSLIARRYVVPECIEEKMMTIKAQKAVLSKEIALFDQQLQGLTTQDLLQLLQE